jgi:hypothetical protein
VQFILKHIGAFIASLFDWIGNRKEREEMREENDVCLGDPAIFHLVSQIY